MLLVLHTMLISEQSFSPRTSVAILDVTLLVAEPQYTRPRAARTRAAGGQPNTGTCLEIILAPWFAYLLLDPLLEALGCLIDTKKWNPTTGTCKGYHEKRAIRWRPTNEQSHTDHLPMLLYYDLTMLVPWTADKLKSVFVTDIWIQGIHESGPRLPREIPYIYIARFIPFIVTRTYTLDHLNTPMVIIHGICTGPFLPLDRNSTPP